MTVPVFPTLAGITYPVKRTQNWSSVKQDALSGKRIRLSLFTYPTYSYEAQFSFLRSDTNDLEWQTLSGFISQLNGPTNLFAYNDPDDNSVTAQAFGTGNGTSTYFQLVRTQGGFIEPVFLLNGTPTLYGNGTPYVAGVDYNINASGNVSFLYAPANGVALTWTGNYYWGCRFDTDTTDFSKFMYELWELKSLKFTTEKLDIINTAPPLWYNAYEIGGTNPLMFADFTTEGGSNHYLYNGTVYAGSSAWCTAVGVTFSRSSSAYYTNSSGLLASASSGALRFDYDPITLLPKGILLEGASTNTSYYSNTFSNSGYWYFFNATVAQTASGPDGTTSAWAVVPSSGSNTVTWTQQSTVPVTANKANTFSLYFKYGGLTAPWLKIQAVSGSPGSVWYNLSTATVGTQGSGASGTITPAQNGFFRLTYTYTPTGSSDDFFIQSAAANGGAAAAITGNGSTAWFYAYQYQVEALAFATSPIFTTAGSATRAADSLTATPISSWYNATTSTLYVDADNLSAANGGAGSVAICNSGGSFGIILGASTLSTSLIAGVEAATTALFSNNDSGQSPPVAGVPRKSAISSNGTSAIYVAAGGTVDTKSATAPSSPTEFALGGSDPIWSNSMYGHIKQVGYWPVAGTGAQLQTLTSGTP
jgi:hypothetical protein